MPYCCLRTHLGSQQCYFIEKPFVVEELITEIDRVKCLTSPASELKAKAISELVLMMILNASKKIQQINKEILNLGKGLNGNFEVLDVGLILVECLDYFTTSVSLSGISIKRNLDVGKVYILVNRFEIEQKFCNLIANGLEAMKNSKTGILTVSVSRKNDLPAGLFSITDTGCGLRRISIRSLRRISLPSQSGRDWDWPLSKR